MEFGVILIIHKTPIALSICTIVNLVFRAFLARIVTYFKIRVVSLSTIRTFISIIFHKLPARAIYTGPTYTIKRAGITN